MVYLNMVPLLKQHFWKTIEFIDVSRSYHHAAYEFRFGHNGKILSFLITDQMIHLMTENQFLKHVIESLTPLIDELRMIENERIIKDLLGVKA